MTSEQRLDRLERIAKLFVRAGLRGRQNIKDQGEKINIIINHQIEQDEWLDRFSQSLERSHIERTQSHNELSEALRQSQNELSQSLERTQSELSQSLERTQNELSTSLNELARAQAHTDRRLNSLIEIVERDRNGDSH